ncbi:MAG: hypothetical protein P1S60_16910 [Anaerolineae bacterium]|nr:hypothetical protein [Anaerolineae bacterium]
MTTQVEEKPGFGKRFWRAVGWFFRFLLRLIVVLIIGAGLGLAVYAAAVYGVQAFNNQLLQPIRDNAQRLDDLESYRTNDKALLNQQMTTQQDQISALQTQGDNHREQLDSLDRRLAASEDDAADALTAVESMQEDIDTLEKLGSTLEPRLASAEKGLDEITRSFDALVADMEAMGQDIESLSTAVADDSAYRVLSYDLMMLKSMQSLLRARLFLTQDNTGLAIEEISDARDQLLILQGMVPTNQQAAVQAILQRLELARGNLPATPDVAVDDLEAAWQLLRLGLPSGAPQVGVLGVPTATLELSPTLAITSTAVLTATEVVTP